MSQMFQLSARPERADRWSGQPRYAGAACLTCIFISNICLVYFPFPGRVWSCCPARFGKLIDDDNEIAKPKNSGGSHKMSWLDLL